MNNNKAIREAAWKRLIAENWIVRFIAVTLFLTLATQFVQNLLNSCYKLCEIKPLAAYAVEILSGFAKTRSVPAGTLPSLRTLIPVFCFDTFMNFIIQGIIVAGFAVLTLRALRRSDEKWFSAALLGLRRPLEWAWLLFRYVLMFVFSGICILFPTIVLYQIAARFCPTSLARGAFLIALIIVAFLLTLVVWARIFYRYRYLFFVKVDNPLASTRACLQKCRALMAGHRKESFYLDCSYWRSFLIFLVLAFVMIACAFTFRYFSHSDHQVLCLIPVAVFFAFTLLTTVVCFVVGLYVRLGQAFLYEAIKTRADEEASNTNVQQTLNED